MKSLLTIYYLFTVAFLPRQELMTDKIERYDNTTHVEFELGVDVYNMVRVFAGEETFQMPESIVEYTPYRQAYWVGLEYHKEFNDKLNLEFGIQHKCTHPVNSWKEQLSKDNETFTEVYLTLSGKIGVF